MKFGRLRYAPAQQGELDGLCGVYVGVNFFCRLSGFDPKGADAKDIFKRILVDLARQEELTVDRICGGGFLEGQLQKAFNREAKHHENPVRVQRFEVFFNRCGAATIFDALALLNDDEAAMLSMNRGDHWVLGFDCDGQKMRVDDSSLEPETVVWQRNETTSLGLSKKHGLVFLNA
jgi:hypothetical protein